jgi:hypothetical protein
MGSYFTQMSAKVRLTSHLTGIKTEWVKDKEVETDFYRIKELALS